ncbi:MAG: hypothetical protein SFT91_04425 [Rickettsiaceae bacterium]|nr:hypothetical protein [Rickettsiaceae bacterium]
MYKKSQQKTIDVNTDPDQMHPFDDKFFGFNPPSRYPGIDLGSGINQNDPEGILTPVVEDIDLDTRKLSGHNDAQSNQHGDVN